MPLATTLLAGLQLLMMPHRVGVASNVDDLTVVDQPVDDLVAAHGAPLLESLVGGEHGRDSVVVGVDELEEERGAVLADRQVADLVDHRRAGRVSTRSRRDRLPAPLASVRDPINPARVPR